jgi:hypothetical protein
MKSIFRKLDQLMDDAMDKQWVRIVVFIALILNVIFGILGVLMLALLTT